MKKLTLIATLASALWGGHAVAADTQAGYYVVVPLKGRAVVAAAGINVTLADYTLPRALVGIPYDGFDFTKLLSVTGDSGYTGYGVKWSVPVGSLPPGLTLTAAGKLVGTATSAGTASFHIRATYKTKNGETAYQVIVGTITVALSSATPPQAIVGQAYSYDLKKLLSVGGDSAYNGSGVTWTVVSSTLPDGLSLRADGTIAGTPTSSGSGSVTARATYRNAHGDQTYEVVTLQVVVALATGTPQQAIVGQAYSYDLKPLLSVTGDSDYNGSGVTWSMVSSTLPDGLVLHNDGTVGGTPTAAGTGTIIARATYRGVNGQQTYQIVTLNIAVTLAVATPPQAIVGQAYSYDLKNQLAVTGDNAYNGSGVTWTVVSSTLPAGITLRSDGTIAGTPTAAGTGSVTARATYRGVNGQQAYQVVTLNIAVTLATGSAPQGIAGQAYSYDLKPLLTVSGDSAYDGTGVTWSTVSSTLPTGLTLRADGTIAGTPTGAGSGSVTARATYRNVKGEQTYQVVTINIVVTLAAGSPPQGIVGQEYSYDLKPLLTVTGDSAYNGSGVTWSAVSSTLPAGLSLGADGTITGTPTAAGSGSVTARATYRKVNGDQAYQVVTINITVSLAAATPPQGIVGQAYSYDLKPLLNVNGDSSYTGAGVTWSTLTGSLPSGLSLNSNGVIVGTPTAAGTGTITARATYRSVNGDRVYQVVTINIVVTLAAATPPQAIVGQAYSYDLKPLLSVGGDSSYSGAGVTWSLVSGSLPSGLSLNSSGLISGTPTSAANATITARATYRNVSGDQAYQVVSLNITVALAAGSPPQAQVGQAYNYDLKPLLTVSGDSAYNGSGVTWSAVSSTLPAGLSLTTGGTITGTPSAATTGSVTAKATYRNVSGQQSYTITAIPAYTYSWQNGSWTVPSACGTTTETRNVWCLRSDGTTVADASCTGTKPTTSASTTDYSSCTYSWSSGAWNVTAACGSTSESRTVTCLRSDGTTVADASCTGTKPATTGSTTDYSTCTYGWQSGAWSVTPACGSTGETRTNTCVRSDGTTVANSYCTSAQPATTATTTDYSTCTYGWQAGSWNVTAACGSTGETRSVWCQRSDGATVGNSYCSGTAPAATGNTTDYSTCTYSWNSSAWTVTPACGSTSESRAVTCLRSDGTTVANSNCTGTAPAASATTTDYSTCTYGWQSSAWSIPSGCGNVTETRTNTCVRSDGTTVANGNCTSAQPATSATTTNYASCTYSWSSSAWSVPSGCGNVTETRTNTCLRSDGTTVANSNCTGTAPAASATTTDYSACTYGWQNGAWNVTAACGSTSESRSVWCQRSDGTTVANSSCSGTAPAATASTTDYSTCTYSWSSSAWTVPSGCGNVTETRTNTCMRSDGTAVASASCTGAAPATSATTTNYATCTYSWQTSAWNVTAACGSTSESRTVSCLRSDGTTVANTSCSGTAPAATASTTDYSTCTYGWQTGAWNVTAACGSTTESRTVTCQRSDGTTVSDTSCTGTKPATSASTTDYSTCTYGWQSSGWSIPSGCGNVTETRTNTCVRSDGSTVANSYCTTAQPATSATTTNYASCTYSWSSSAWSVPSGCGNVTETRTTTCMRSDGTAVSAASCGTAPAASATTTDYSSCSYSWSAGAWNVTAACGTTSESRTVSCLRSDGTTVAGTYCSGAAPAATASTTDYSTCSYAWQAGAWSVPAACGSTTETRSVSCVRSDGTAVAGSYCTGTAPASSASTTDYSSCTYSWSTSGWSVPSGCGNVTETRTNTCMRSDGTAVAASYCGTAPATSATTTNYASCTYSWSSSAWSIPSGCGNVTETRTNTCMRSDGTAVAASYCGTAPASSATTTNYSSCSYSWSYGGWSTPSGCGSVTATRSASCVRSDGSVVSNAYCGTPTTSMSTTDYSSCSYSWSYGAWSTPSGCGNVTATRSATCVRSDGASVSNAYCGTPTTSMTSSDYSACSYSTGLGSWSACSASCGGGTQTRSVSCTRSDGTAVSTSYCGSPATSQSCNTQACAAATTWQMQSSDGCAYSDAMGSGWPAISSKNGTSCSPAGSTTRASQYMGGCGPSKYLMYTLVCK